MNFAVASRNHRGLPSANPVYLKLLEEVTTCLIQHLPSDDIAVCSADDITAWFHGVREDDIAQVLAAPPAGASKDSIMSKVVDQLLMCVRDPRLKDWNAEEIASWFHQVRPEYIDHLLGLGISKRATAIGAGAR